MNARLRWGILGTGLIADWFATDLSASANSHLTAAASRDLERAEVFTARHGGRAYGDYAQLLEDDEVEAVYIGLPNHLHVAWAIAAALAGKHVLCEKPIGLDATQAAGAFQAAEDMGVVLLEGFMFRMHPQSAVLHDVIAGGTIGEVRLIESSFGGRIDEPGNIRLQNAYGGGALMDLGSYGVSLSRMVSGARAGRRFADPQSVTAVGHVGDKLGVDEWSVATLRFDDDLIATVACSNNFDLPSVARIWGTEGDIQIPNPWQPGFRSAPAELVLNRRDGSSEVIVIDETRPLYAIEADLFAACVRSGGDIPVPTMDRLDSLGNMRVLDCWRAELGVEFETDIGDTQ